MAGKRETSSELLKGSDIEGIESDSPVDYPQRIRELNWQIEMLENEVSDLRRQLSTAPDEDVDARLYEMTRELMQAHRRNRKLTTTLQEAKEKLELLKEKVKQLSAPPNNYGIFLGTNDDNTIDVDISGKKWRVNLDPAIKADQIQVGQEVIVNSGLNVVAIKPPEKHGDVVKIKEVLESDRAVVSLRTDEEQVVRVSAALKDETLKTGDSVLLNHTSGMLLEKLPKRELDDLLLEEVPDISYADIGGLDTQIEAIRDAIEMPYLYPNEYREFDLTPPKACCCMAHRDVGKH